jgi:hypothetical protein
MAGYPVVFVDAGGLPVTYGSDGNGWPIEEALSGLPVTIVAAGGLPVVEGVPDPLLNLFAGGKDGGFYGFPYEPGVGLYQERTGAAATTPSMVGDPVGTIIDKSGNGRHRVASADAARPILRQDGNGLYYLERDATDDNTRSAATYTISMPQFILAGYAKGQESNVTFGATKNSTNHHRLLTFSSGRTAAVVQAADGAVAAATAITGNNATPVGTLVLASSQAKASSVDIAINGGIKISVATGWTTETVTTAYLGDAALALVSEYGFIQVASQPSEVARQAAAEAAGEILGLTILPNVFDIILLGGQSNMIGRADASGDAQPADTYQYNGTDVTVATVPLDHTGELAGDLGPDVTFADAWHAANSGRNILFVPAAEGSTRFSNGGWRKGGTQYNRLVNRAIALQAAYPNATIRGLLMALGENDTLAGGGSATFQTDMDQFIADVRSDLGLSTLPVVWGGMAPTWVASNGAYAAYQAVIEAVGTRNNYAAYASSAGLASIALDDVHLDRDGLRTIGTRYYDGIVAAAADAP